MIEEGKLANSNDLLSSITATMRNRCNICGNEITVTKVGGGTLVCCGEDMEKIESASS